MDLKLTPEQELWRQEIRDFIVREVPDDLGDLMHVYDDEETFRKAVALTRKLGARKWIGIAWPKEYGGLQLSPIDQMIFSEEMSYHRVPNLSLMGAGYLGPMIMFHGTQAQKDTYLPSIMRGEVIWCQGFSEPNAGSDLASLQTTAVRAGDDYVVNGTKLWTSHAHRSDFILLGARTDPEAPKHRGISMFLAPMDQPGLVVHPLVNTAGQKHFNQIFFEDMRIPKDYLIGEENRGWYQMATALDMERSNISGTAERRRDLEDLVDFCRSHRRNGRPLLADPLIRNHLAELAVELNVARMLSYRIGCMQQKGRIPNTEASMAKIFSNEVGGRLSHVGMEILGLYGPIRDPRWEILKGRFAEGVLNCTAGGGTVEIQRNIIAQRGLGLPR
jgi:alkylation response protein AidB-like acyl-CoA dehydrogenase